MTKKKEKESFWQRNKGHLIFTAAVLFVLLIAFTLIVPTKTITYEVEVTYTDTENYTEKEPYEAQESYKVQESYESVEYYTDTVPIEKSIPYTDYETVVHDAPYGQYYPSCDSCSCTKTSIWFGNCIQCTCSAEVTKYKTEVVYEEIEKERPVIKYRPATKYRTITKYQEVEKTREVIKTKMEAREMEVNWLFEFKLPYKLHLPFLSYRK